MSWDTTQPEDDDLIALGPSEIRTFKEDVETALTTEGSFPGADPTNPKFRYTPPRGNTASRPSTGLVTGQLYINTQTGALERYNGATWDEVNTLPASGGILTTHIGDAQVTAAKIAAAVAGDGLTGGAGTALAVNPDNSTLEISGDAVRVKDAGITSAKLDAAVAGDGLVGGAGSALAVNPDNSTLEISSDAVRVKDAGITEAKLATAVVNKLGQNIGYVARGTTSGNATVVNYSGQGRLMGIVCEESIDSCNIEVTIDGVTVYNGSIDGSNCNGLRPADSTNESYPLEKVDTSGGGERAKSNSLGIHFKTSLVVTTTGNGGKDVHVYYERQA